MMLLLLAIDHVWEGNVIPPFTGSAPQRMPEPQPMAAISALSAAF